MQKHNVVVEKVLQSKDWYWLNDDGKYVVDWDLLMDAMINELKKEISKKS